MEVSIFNYLNTQNLFFVITGYVFHEKGKVAPISKDSYEQNLRKRCKRLGTLPKNNHAFRIAFNSKMIELGFSAADRALILGHEIQTNETHYSLTDKRRLEDIRARMIGCHPLSPT